MPHMAGTHPPSRQTWRPSAPGSKRWPGTSKPPWPGTTPRRWPGASWAATSTWRCAPSTWPPCSDRATLRWSRQRMRPAPSSSVSGHGRSPTVSMRRWRCPDPSPLSTRRELPDRGDTWLALGGSTGLRAASSARSGGTVRRRAASMTGRPWCQIDMRQAQGVKATHATSRLRAVALGGSPYGHRLRLHPRRVARADLGLHRPSRLTRRSISSARAGR